MRPHSDCCDRIRSIPVSGTRSQSGRWASSYSIFVERLLKQEEVQQPLGGLRLGRPQPRVGHGFAIGGKERLGGPVAPFVERRGEPALLVGGDLERALQRGGGRIIDRTDQAGDVARRRRLAPPFGERAARLAVEIDDEDVVLDDQHLAEMEVAVMADVEPVDRRAAAARSGGRAGLSRCASS